MTVPDAASPARAVFLDRDGTVMVDRGYLADPDGVRLAPGAAEALRRLARAGCVLVLVTNQSGVARGYFDMSAVDRVHDRLRDMLRGEGIKLAAIHVCPHGPDDGCSCRKPAPGLILRACADLGIDARASFMVGDKVSDAEAGRRAGCAAVLIGDEHGEHPQPAADHVCRDLEAAGDWILARAQPVEGAPR